MNHDPWRWAAFALYLLAWLAWAVAPDFFLRHPGVTGLALLALALLVFLARSAHTLALLDLLPALALLGMWVAPWIQYELEEAGRQLSNVRMAVPADRYFAVCMPATLALAAGSQLPWPIRGGGGLPPNAAPLRPVVFLITGALGWLVVSYLPAGWKFFGALLQSTVWLAVWSAAIRPPGVEDVVTALTALVLVALQAVYSTMFSALGFGLLVFLLVAALRGQWGAGRLAVLLLGLALATGFLLSFKYEFRRLVRPHHSLSDRAGLLAGRLSGRLADPVSVAAFDYVLSRLNQGMHTAGCLAYVPAREPFAGGATIGRAVLGALAPRMFWPGKPRAGGAENRRRFLGLGPLDYSFNIGPVGEAYANFGARGAPFFLLAYAGMLRGLYDAMLAGSRRRPALLLWIPFVFIPAVSVETDVFTVLNHVTKAGLLALTLAWSLTALQRFRQPPTT
jgi:hypothetical protein